MGDIDVEGALRKLPPFSVRIERDGDQWTARGIEYDIAAQHDTFHGVCEAFARAFVGQAVVNMHHGKEPMGDVPRGMAIDRIDDLTEQLRRVIAGCEVALLEPDRTRAILRDMHGDCAHVYNGGKPAAPSGELHGD